MANQLFSSMFDHAIVDTIFSRCRLVFFSFQCFFYFLFCDYALFFFFFCKIVYPIVAGFYLIVNRHRRFTYKLVDFFFFVRPFVRSSVRSILHFVFSILDFFSFVHPILHFVIIFFFYTGLFFSSILLFTSISGDFFFLSCSVLHFTSSSYIGFFSTWLFLFLQGTFFFRPSYHCKSPQAIYL